MPSELSALEFGLVSQLIDLVLNTSNILSKERPIPKGKIKRR